MRKSDAVAFELVHFKRIFTAGCRLLCPLALAVLAACAGSPRVWTPSETIANVYLDDSNRLIYNGPISKAANRKLFDLYQEAVTTPSTISIMSTGGSTMAGLDLGTWLESQDIDVEIEQLCASSCANYVLPAARTVHLHPRAVLLWHGSLWQEWDPEFLNCELWKERQREADFFDRRGIDNLITVLGQRQITLIHRLKALFGDSPIGYDYSIEDLERLGLRNLKQIGGRWNWRPLRPDWADNVFRATVPKGYQFRESRFLTPSALEQIRICREQS